MLFFSNFNCAITSGADFSEVSRAHLKNSAPNNYAVKLLKKQPKLSSKTKS